MKPIEEMISVGQSPKRFGWLIKPLRRFLFPLVRPYFNYILEHLEDASLLPSGLMNIDDNAKKFEKRLQKLSEKQRSLASREQVISQQIQQLANRFDAKDFGALLFRLSSIEDRMIEMNQFLLQNNQQHAAVQEKLIQLSNKADDWEISVSRQLIELTDRINSLDKVNRVMTQMQDRVSLAAAEVDASYSDAPMISYAQNGEDILLSRLFKGKTDGFFIDVGAALPIDHSVTYHFYKQGWHGINIEPIPQFFNMFQLERLRDINLRCAMGSVSGTHIFYEVADNLGRSSMDSKTANDASIGHEVIQYEVPVITLNDLYERYSLVEVDFLKIDVEGWEREVLLGNDWSKNRPCVVLVESIHPVTHSPEWENWEYILLENKYTFACFDGLNRFYVRSEDEHLAEQLKYPVNVLDNYMPHSLYKVKSHLETIQTLLSAS